MSRHLPAVLLSLLLGLMGGAAGLAARKTTGQDLKPGVYFDAPTSVERAAIQSFLRDLDEVTTLARTRLKGVPPGAAFSWDFQRGAWRCEVAAVTTAG